jgi:uncharacterized membrane protein YuzA (DUF378 family)
MKGMHMVAFILLVIGGLNWLLIGLGGWNIVNMIFGGMGMWVERIIYILVGLAAIWEVAMHKQNCKLCGSSMAKTM